VHPTLVALGCVLTVTVWLSVLRTVFTPRAQSTRAAWWSIKVVASIGLPVARRLPDRPRERFLDSCAPLALFVMVTTWLAGIAAGFVLLAYGIHAGRLGDLLDGDAPAPSARPVAAAAALSAGLVLAAFTTHLVRVTGAYSRRERLVARLGGQAARPPDAEMVLADYLRAGSRDRLDVMFAEWAGWLADVWCTHVGYPALTFARPANSLCWIKAALIVLDAAGLTQAVAPNWAPPHTRSLLRTGSNCLQSLAAQVGVTPGPAPVSLHGREEQGFTDTVRLVVDAGLPKERNDEAAWKAFQALRIHYAPYAAGVAAYLLYRDGAEVPLEEGEPARPAI
jgi:hypothetical protein